MKHLNCIKSQGCDCARKGGHVELRKQKTSEAHFNRALDGEVNPRERFYTKPPQSCDKYRYLKTNINFNQLDHLQVVFKCDAPAGCPAKNREAVILQFKTYYNIGAVLHCGQ